MYSYISIQREKLTPAQIGIYQSYYCGLCLQLKEDFGSRARLLLIKDMTFLVMLLSSMYGEEPETREFYCPRHPGRKKCCRRGEAAAYVAAMTVALSVCLESGKSPFAAKIAEIRKQYPRQVGAMEEGIQQLKECLSSENASLELYQASYGEILGELFAWREDEWYDELKCLGYHLGRFICIMRAFEVRDQKEKAEPFNPFLHLYRETPDRFESLLSLMMRSMIDECKKSFCHLELVQNQEILYHMLNEGVWVRYSFLQKKFRKQKRKMRGKRKSQKARLS